MLRIFIIERSLTYELVKETPSPLYYSLGLKKLKIKRGKFMEQWETYLDLYLKYKKALKLSQRTIDDARYHVTRLFSGKQVDFKDFPSLKKLIIEYFADSDDISPVTFNTRLKNLKTFFRWMVDEGILQKSPLDNIKKAREDRKPRHTTLEVIKMMLDKCDLKTYLGLRDYIGIALSFDTAIRPSELEKLVFPDFDLLNSQFTVRAEIAKTRISRTLPINEKLIPYIEKLYQYQIEAGWEKDIPFFSNLNKTPLDRFSWRRRLALYTEGTENHVSPYMLRHSAAIEMVRNKASAFHVQSMLGHSNMNTTKIYVNLAISDLKEIHSVSSPLNKVI